MAALLDAIRKIRRFMGLLLAAPTATSWAFEREPGTNSMS
jgi:hypothetical protein